MSESERVTYNPRIFDVHNIQSAKSVILTPEMGKSSAFRWEWETPYLVDLISEKCSLTQDSWVLDFGCGIGRLAKPLIQRYGCKIVGVDMAASMRALSMSYVGVPNFFAIAPGMLPELPIRFDLALCVWTLQHCLNPIEELGLIHNALAANGKLFILNNNRRAVPTLEHSWVDDGIDVTTILRDADFGELEFGEPKIGIQDAEKWCFWRLYHTQER
jgi:SAM-dependent methyltransferase